MQRKVLIFSTLNPYPFWAGSEKFWFDFVSDSRAHADFKFHLVLADSPATRSKVTPLIARGVVVSFYNHFNVSPLRRNAYRLWDALRKCRFRTLPWYEQIKHARSDLVWFNVAGLADLVDLAYPVQICKKLSLPYWLVLQHSYEDFFFGSKLEIEAATEVATSARRFIFVAEKNRVSLERAIGVRLDNALRSVNSLSADEIRKAKEVAEKHPVDGYNRARFFNLARFSPKDKAQHVLLEALAAGEWKRRDWELSFIGVSDFGSFYLRKLAAYYGIDPNRIRFIPHTENVLSMIAEQDLLLMPSLAEGMPFAMLESMACARPALGTPVGGIPELVWENRTGWLARTTDVGDVQEAIERAWQNCLLWKQFGQNAQQHVELHHNQEKVHADLLRVLIEDLG